MKREKSLWMFAALVWSLGATACFGWGSEGHRIINRLAVKNPPPDVPDFLRSPAAIDEIEYLGPEPDRWRSIAEPELSSAQAPEHFIDLELADRIGPLPRNRFDYIAALYATAAAHPEWSKELGRNTSDYSRCGASHDRGPNPPRSLRRLPCIPETLSDSRRAYIPARQV